MSAKTPVKGHAAKHVHKKVKHHKAKGKHHPSKQHQPATGTGHNVHTVATHAKPAKPRGFAVGDLLPACAAEAVAMSLRLAGQPVSDDEVAWLWELAGARELSIPEALAAAARFGLAGFRVQPAPDEFVVADLGDDLAELQLGARIGGHLLGGDAAQFEALGGLVANRPSIHAAILGVDVPGPHCVLATPDGWWSWGQLWSPWPCRIEEAWTVTWS